MNNQRWLELRNDSGEEIPAFAIVRLTGTHIDHAGRVMLTGAKPNVYGSQYRHAVNGRLAIPDGKSGLCTLDFPAMALYDTADGTPVVGQRWGPRSGTWKLKKNTGGFVVAGLIDEDAGRMMVSQNPMLSFFGKWDSDVSKGGSGTVSVWAGTIGSESDTSENVSSVYNRVKDVVSGDATYVSWVDDGWQASPAECEA